MNVLGPLAFGFIKLSVIFFYRRIFVGKWFNIITWTMAGLSASWGLSIVLGEILTCSPVAAHWGTRIDLFTKCGNTYNFLKTYAVSDVVLDTLILAIPIILVWRLHLPISRKVQICGLFLMVAL